MAFVVPCVHPAYILHDGKPIIDYIRLDLAKALRLGMGGEPQHYEQHIICLPSVPGGHKQAIQNAIAWIRHWRANRTPVALDVEASSLEFWALKLYSLALSGMDEHHVGISYTTGDLFTLPIEDFIVLDTEVRGLLADENVPKIYQNRPYDEAVLRRKGYTLRGYVYDTLGASHLMQPDIDHDLGSLGHAFLDVDPWKLDHEGRKRAFETDIPELLLYNSRDAIRTACLVDPLTQQILDRGMSYQVIDVQMRLSEIAVEMEMAGIPVNRERRLAMGRDLLQQVQKLLYEMRELLCWPDFNPNSPKHRIEALFHKYQLKPVNKTPTGLPATGREDLLDYLEHPFVMRFVKYGELSKAHASWYGIKGIDGCKKDGSFTRNIFGDDRLHPKWSAYGQTAPRMTSSPNVQNVTLEHRAFFEAPYGYVFVGADKDQLELRVSACEAGEEELLEEMRKVKGDPHTMAAIRIFGEDFTSQSKADQKLIRDGLKNTTYAGLYEAQLKTIHTTIRKNKYISPELRGSLTMEFVAKMHGSYFGRYTKIFEENKRVYAHALQKGYSKIEPYDRMRCWLVQPPNYNEVVNWRVQARGVEHVNICVQRMREAIQHYRIQDCNIVQHGHDSVAVLCKEKDAEMVKWITNEHFGKDYIEGPAGWVNLSCDAKIGRTLKDLK